jgi:hypothetical protein
MPLRQLKIEGGPPKLIAEVATQKVSASTSPPILELEMQPSSQPSSTDSNVYNFKKAGRSLSKKNLIIDMLEPE